MNKTMSNPEVRFLVLARPADTLFALTRQLVPHHDPAAEFCSSVYDAVAALHTLDHARPVILIARPAMLAVPHLAAVLRQYPNLRLIGWLGPDERLHAPVPMQTEQPMVTVSDGNQLIRVITAIRHTLANKQILRDFEASKQDSKIEPANYRLSSEELDALLGAG